MNVFFDNNTAPVLASTLQGYFVGLPDNEHRALHVRDLQGLPEGRHSKDVAWIAFLSAHADDWIFVTGDLRVTKNAAERQALRAAGLHGFVLSRAYQKTPQNQIASMLLWYWPDIETLFKTVAAPSMYEIPIGRRTKLRQLPL